MGNIRLETPGIRNDHDADFDRQFSPPPDDPGNTALYIGGGLAALLLVTFAIPPARRAFFAAIKGLKNKASSLDEISRALGTQSRTDNAFALIQAMRGDQFYRSNPFCELGDMAAMRKILDRGVESFERKIYRTATHVKCWNSGYDCVAYEVTHRDDTFSLIRAFKYQESPFDTMGVGGTDVRKTYFDFWISEGNGTMARYLYRGSNNPDLGSSPYKDGLRVARDFIDWSVKNRGLVPLKGPDQIVFL
ncbi:MAG: hypothetical protein HYY44_09495 [Deltaproteobacteria bacterium]|nr:hypothetical protein [Deltaproteobacteria bacterium]MBI4373856.1 hypothetical protein [Deltaproteobacteria bacterium]